jgi:SAM-dependent methyltransferase
MDTDTLSVCPLCGGDWKSISAPPVAIGHSVFSEAFGLARCRTCNARFVNPRPSAERLERFYNSDEYECHAVSGASDPHVRLDIVERLRQPSSLCDFGCGSGELLRAAQKRGWDVCGIEPGAPRKHLEFDIYPDLSKMSRQVDVFTMVHVLEHCPSPADTLFRLRKALKPNGLIYIEVPNVNSLRARLGGSFLRPLWTHDPERYLAFPIHLFYFHPFSLRRLLTTQGYKILEIGTMGIGVEELFTSKPQTVRNDTSSSVSSSRNGSRFQFAKNVIKSVLYGSLLGENLYVVATVS